MSRRRARGAMRLPSPVAVVVVVTVGVPSVVGAAGATAAASPADSTTVTFDVEGSPRGGLHLSVAPDGGLTLPPGGPADGVPLPRAVVHDDRGGGPRAWSTSVTTVGVAESWEVSYRVTALRSPDTGATLNRMPDWTGVRAAREAVVSTGISGLSETSAWDPRLRVGRAPGGTRSIGTGSSGSTSAGAGGSIGTGSIGSVDTPGRPDRDTLVTSVL